MLKNALSSKSMLENYVREHCKILTYARSRSIHSRVQLNIIIDVVQCYRFYNNIIIIILYNI